MRDSPDLVQATRPRTPCPKPLCVRISKKAVTKPKDPEAAPATPEEQFQAASRNEAAGLVSEALLGYRVLVTSDPTSELGVKAAKCIAAIEARAAVDKATKEAARSMVLAKNHEKSGNSAAALRVYRQIVKDYPKTPQAMDAGKRIKALEVPK
jgi:hypothetical protein